MTDTELTEVPPHDGPPGRSVGWNPSGDDGFRGEVAGGAWRLALLALATAAVGVWAGRGWVFIIGAITVMIFLHELGHYLTAKWSGMKVTEFFLFFGPKVWSFRRGETEYGIKLIPIGAYVRIIGMNNLDDVAPQDEPRTYRQQSFPKRMLVITAGSLMHFAQAIVLFFIVFSLIGVPGGSSLGRELGGPDQRWHVDEVASDSGAAAAGVEVGDRILSIDGAEIASFNEVGDLVRGRIGDELPIVVERDGQQVQLTATIGERTDEAGVGFLGIGPEYLPMAEVTANPFRGALEAGEHVGDAMWQTGEAMGRFFTGGFGRFADDVADGSSERGETILPPRDGSTSRPVTEGDQDRLVSMVGVSRWGAAAAEDGMADFLILLGFINVSIGVLNLLPLLPLDGGHAAVAVYERIRSIRGRRHMADVSRLLPLTYAVAIVGLMVMMSAVYLDIVDPVNPG